MNKRSMVKRVEAGWTSPFYSESVAIEWVEGFRKDYPRATEMVLKVLAKSVQDTVKLASQSQFGWESFKKTVKKVNLWLSNNNASDKLKYMEKVKEKSDLIRCTIQLLSSEILIWLMKNENSAKREAYLLTSYYGKLL